MSYQDNQAFDSLSGYHTTMAAHAAESDRTAFIRRTYMHLTAAVLLFVVLELAIFTLIPEATMQKAIGAMVGGWNFLLVLLAFVVVSSVANKWAASATSVSTQYMGLGLYVLAEAAIFVPLLYIAGFHGGEGTIASAGVITTFVFLGLTMIVFVTRADFSWMGQALMLMGFVLLGMILCSILFGFHMGVIISCVGIGLAGGYILYFTSKVMNRFRTDQHVVAALCLFAAVALLFYYILLLMMSRD